MLWTCNSYEQQVIGSTWMGETGSSGGRSWGDAEGERGRWTETHPSDFLHSRRTMTLVQLVVGHGGSWTQITCPVTPGYPGTFPQKFIEKCWGSGASCSSDGSWSSWHRECRFQEKPQRAGAARVGMSLKLKPLGICALRRRPEATGLSKVNAIPGMGTACPSGSGASLKPWLLSLRPGTQESRSNWFSL